MNTAPGILERLRSIGRGLKQEIDVYRLALKHPRTPRSARWLLGLAIAYAVSPIDLIPDFIPVLGHLDDVLIVPALAWLALRRIPKDILEDCRREVAERTRA